MAHSRRPTAFASYALCLLTALLMAGTTLLAALRPPGAAAGVGSGSRPGLAAAPEPGRGAAAARRPRPYFFCAQDGNTTLFTAAVGALTASVNVWTPVTVTALTGTGAQDTAFTGSVTLTSTDGGAEFSNSSSGSPTLTTYTFAGGDNGQHLFYVKFANAGFQTVTATDTNCTGVIGVSPIVTAAAVLISNNPAFSTPTQLLSNSYDFSNNFALSTNVGSSATQTVHVQLSNGITFQAAALASGFDTASGGPGDFALATASCNTVGTVQTCGIPVTFQPSRPGLRQAPLVITDTSSHTYYLGFTGLGSGAAIAFTPGIIKRALATVVGSTVVAGAIDSAGNQYLANNTNHTSTVAGAVYELSPAGSLTTVAGGGTVTTFPATATQAALDGPSAVRADAAGNLVIDVAGDNTVIKLDRTTGQIIPVAGAYTPGNGSFAGDGGAATSAKLNAPNDVVTDAAGNIYIADYLNFAVRKVDAATGIISTYAGTGGAEATAHTLPSNGAAANTVKLGNPASLAVDSAGNLYVGDVFLHAVFRIDTTGKITTFAGTGTAGSTGDGGLASSATLNTPNGLAVDTANDVYISDTSSNVVRRVDATSGGNATPGQIHTVIGGGTPAAGFGDNGAATDAKLNGPVGVWADSVGSLYVADTGDNEIRSVAVKLGQIDNFGSALLGTSTAYQPLLITNVGNQAFTVNSFAIASTNSPAHNPVDFAQDTADTPPTGTSLCTSSESLNPGTGCSFDVQFSPSITSGLGPDNGTVAVANSLASASATLTGTGVQASVSPASWTFIASGVHAAAPTESITFTNPSTNGQVVNFTSVLLSGPNAGDFSLSSNTCTGAVAAPGCSVTVTYTAGSGGSETATLTFTDVASNSPQTVSLLGTIADTPANMAVSPNTAVTAAIGSAYSTFTATVTDSSSVGVPGIAVTFTAPTFTAPSSGPSGYFADTGTYTTTAYTNASGVATAPAFIANTLVGTYTINVTAAPAPAQTITATNLALSQNVGSTTTPVTVAFNFSSSNPVADVQVYTQGASGADFTQIPQGSTNDCTVKTYTSGFCTVEMNFAPKAPGLRRGAVVLFDASGNVLETLEFGGTGTAPAITFNAGSPPASLLFSGVQTPFGVTVDTAGNIFAADPTNQRVLEVAAGSSTPIVLSAVAAAAYPSDVTVDGAGNIFAADATGATFGQIIEFPHLDGAYGAATALIQSFGGPAGIVADGSGNVYFSENNGAADIQSFSATNPLLGNSPLAITGVTLVTPSGLALDNSGNLYVADPGLTTPGVVQINLSTLVATELTMPGNLTLVHPVAVAVDAAGDLYIADSSTAQKIYEVPAGGGNAITLASSINIAAGAAGLALDASGNLYYSASGSGGTGVHKLDLADAPALATFPSTVAFTSSAAETLTAGNIGNLPLSFASIAAGTLNFTNGGTTCGATLAAGSQCLLGATFTPQSVSPSLSDTLTVKHNALNVANTTAAFALSGASTAGVVTQVVFTTQPGTTYASGATFTVVATVEDAHGDPVTGSSDSVTLAFQNNAGSGTLSGTLTATASSGVATFSGISVDKVSTGYTLKATDTTASPNLVSSTSSAFNITPGAAAKLAFSVQPTNAQSLTAIAPAVTVTVQDASGNTVTTDTSNITLAIGTNPSSGTLTGGTATAAVAGVATFSNLKIDKAGTGYTLAASDGSLTSATSSAFAITPGAAAKLAFSVQPTNAQSLTAIAPAVTVTVQDASGNTVTTDTSNITLAIGTNPSSGTLTGGTATAAVAGVATFSNLKIDKAGTGYTLGASDSLLTTATSSAFNITPGAAAKVVFTTQPGTTYPSGTAFSVAATIEDASNNVVTTSSDSVTLAFQNNAGPGTLGGTLTATATAGVGTFSGISVDNVATGYTLKASDGGLTAGASSAFSITKASSTTSWSPSSSSIVYGTSLAGILNASGTGTITYTTGGNTVTPTSVLPVTGSPYTLTATSAGDANHNGSTATYTLTVTPAPLVITASSPSTPYGTVPAITASYATFVNGESATSLTTAPTCSTTASATSPAGTPVASSCTGAVDANYSITYAAGAVTVTKASSTTTWSPSSSSIVYGTTLSGILNATGTGTITYNDGHQAVTSTTVEPVTGSPYTITATSAGDANHNGSTATYTLTVTPAPLVITASSPSTPYGTVPTITATYATFVNGESATSLTTAPTCSTTASATSAVGSSPTTSCSGAVDANYSITYVAGAATVTKANTTTTWSPSSSSIVYGTALTGILNATGTGTITYNDGHQSVTAATVEPVGSYTVTATSAGDANHNGSTATYTLTVTPAPLVITASSPSTPYGTVPAITASYATFVNGESASSLTTVPNCSTTASATSAVGSSPTTFCSGAVDANYSISYVAGAVTVTKANTTTTWSPSSSSIVYGTTLTGILNATGSGTITYNDGHQAVTATTVEPVTGSPYTITATSAGDANHNGSTATYFLTVTQAPQTITFNPLANHSSSDAPFTLTASASSGLSVSFAVIAGPASIAGNTVTLTGAGTVTIQATQPGNANYTAAAPVSQSFTVTPLVTASTLSFSSTGLNFGSLPVGSTSGAQTVVATNAGTLPVTVSSIAASGDYAEGSACTTIAPGGSCSVLVSFTPTVLGTRAGTLTFTDSATGSPQAVSLTGIGTAPGVVVTPATLVFGSQLVGSTSTAQSVTIENTGTALLHVSSVTASGDFAAASNCSVIPAGSSCSVGVTFTPTQAGSRGGSLTISDDGGSGTQVVALSGNGNVAGVALAPSSLTFPATLVGGTSFNLSANLSNTGTVAITGIAISTQGDFAQTNTCGASLAAGATCTLTVTFTPSVVGTESGTIAIADSLGQQSLALAGTGVAPGVSLSGGQLIFGGQLIGTSSNAQSVTLTNSGTSALTINSITPSTDFNDTTNCGATLAAGASCSVNIFFTPSVKGPETGTVTLSDSAGTQVVTTTGQGQNAGLDLSPSFAIFGGQVVGTSSLSQTLTLTNNGTVTLTLAPVTVTGDFSESSQCPATLTPGASCDISVTFTPSALGNRAGALTASDSSNLSSAIATFNGQGTIPGLVASPSNLSFGTITVGSTSLTQTVTVSNSGSAAGSVGAITVSGDFAETNNCTGAPIAPGGYCIINVSMSPTTTGTRTGKVEITDSSAGIHDIALDGAGQNAGLDIFPTQLAFGSLPIPLPGALIGLSGTQLSVTLTNIGTTTIHFSGFKTQGDFTESDDCSTSLAPAARCVLSINFIATAVGHRTGTLTISDDVGGGTQVVSLQGDGSPGGLILTPPVLNFGVQTVGVPSAAQPATLTNNTGENITNLVITPSGEYNETNTCGTTLANGASCPINISITPVEVGAITGTVNVTGTLVNTGKAPAAVHASLAAPQDSSSTNFSLGVVALTATANPPGVGLSLPNLSFSLTAIGTASVGQTLTLTNTGTGLPLTGLIFTSSPEFPETNNCPTTLVKGASCTITVTFQPAGAGLRTGYFHVLADGGIDVPVPESGLGLGPQLTVAPNTVTFGSRPAHTASAAQIITLQNTGAQPLIITGFNMSSSEFTMVSNGCGTLPATLGVGATCGVGVVFSPGQSGKRFGILTILSNTPGGSTIVALQGTGSTSGLTFSPASLAFGTQGVGASSSAQTITITNPGAAAVGIASIAFAPSGNYSQTNNCSTSLAAGASCTMAVVFAPTATGEQDASIAVTNDAGVQVIPVTGSGSDFAITYAGNLPAAVTQGAGSRTTYNLGLTSLSGDNQTIALSCAADAGFTCSAAPGSVAIGAQPGTFVLTLTSNARVIGSLAIGPAFGSGNSGQPLALLGYLLALLLLLGAFLRRRRVGLTLAGAGMLLLFSAACGTPSTPPLNPSTHHVTVTAVSSTGATHSKVLDLVVQ